MVATLVLFGTAEADFRLQAFLSSTAAAEFGNEAEASVRIYSDNNRDDHITLICCSSVEFLRKLYDINTMLTKSRSNWWCWCCFASRNLLI